MVVKILSSLSSGVNLWEDSNDQQRREFVQGLLVRNKVHKILHQQRKRVSQHRLKEQLRADNSKKRVQFYKEEEEIWEDDDYFVFLEDRFHVICSQRDTQSYLLVRELKALKEKINKGKFSHTKNKVEHLLAEIDFVVDIEERLMQIWTETEKQCVETRLQNENTLWEKLQNDIIREDKWPFHSSYRVKYRQQIELMLAENRFTLICSKTSIELQPQELGGLQTDIKDKLSTSYYFAEEVKVLLGKIVRLRLQAVERLSEPKERATAMDKIMKDINEMPDSDLKKEFLEMVRFTLICSKTSIELGELQKELGELQTDINKFSSNYSAEVKILLEKIVHKRFSVLFVMQFLNKVYEKKLYDKAGYKEDKKFLVKCKNAMIQDNQTIQTELKKCFERWSLHKFDKKHIWELSEHNIFDIIFDACEEIWAPKNDMNLEADLHGFSIETLPNVLGDFLKNLNKTVKKS